jgi:hypothetical protein
MSSYLGKEFHRRSVADASKDERQQASSRLKEETQGQTLGEWFNKEKKKPAPKAKAEDEEKKPTSKSDYDPECVICQNEGPRDNNNGKHQHVYQE